MLLALLLSFAIPQLATADDSLGLGVRIENDPEATELYMGNRLWYGIEPGEQKTRSFVITSRSEIAQEINLYLYDKQFTNGQESVDSSQPSATTQWATFEPNSMVLQPGQEQRFTMTYTIPEDAPDLAYNSVLRVVATAATAAEGAEDSASAVVRGAAAVELGVFLGIGDALELVPSFNIESIRGVRLPEGRFLEIELLNNGRVPIQLVGTAQLADPQFAERNFGPFDYVSREIFPDEKVIAQVAMPDEVESGEWRVFVTAEFGQIKQTRLFEQTLNFIPPGSQLSLWDWIIRIGLISLLAVGVVVGMRLLRSKPPTDPGDEIEAAKTPVKPPSKPSGQKAKPAKPKTTAGAIASTKPKTTAKPAPATAKKAPATPSKTPARAAAKAAIETPATKPARQAATKNDQRVNSAATKKGPKPTKKLSSPTKASTTKKQPTQKPTASAAGSKTTTRPSAKATASKTTVSARKSPAKTTTAKPKTQPTAAKKGTAAKSPVASTRSSKPAGMANSRADKSTATKAQAAPKISSSKPGSKSTGK